MNAIRYSILAVVAVGLVVVIGAYLFVGHGSAFKKHVATNSCVSQRLTTGSSGSCVSDAQTLINFVETDGLTMCPFVGSQSLPINGSFGTSTQDQVIVFQSWVNCYNKQEGVSSTIATDGVVDSSTWSELCTYGYQYPKQSDSSVSPFLKQSITAGTNAGC